jgi:Transposase domain (DUF772)
MTRMLFVGYCYDVRSERRLCDEVHLNLGYRWFYRLSLDGDVPDHFTFSKNRHGRFRDDPRSAMTRAASDRQHDIRAVILSLAFPRNCEPPNSGVVPGAG